MSMEENNREITVIGPDKEKIVCRKCKYAVNGALQNNCLKYAEKPYEVYFKNEECPRFKLKKMFEDFKKEQ